MVTQHLLHRLLMNKRCIRPEKMGLGTIVTADAINVAIERGCFSDPRCMYTCIEECDEMVVFCAVVFCSS